MRRAQPVVNKNLLELILGSKVHCSAFGAFKAAIGKNPFPGPASVENLSPSDIAKSISRAHLHYMSLFQSPRQSTPHRASMSIF